MTQEITTIPGNDEFSSEDEESSNDELSLDDEHSTVLEQLECKLSYVSHFTKINNKIMAFFEEAKEEINCEHMLVLLKQTSSKKLSAHFNVFYLTSLATRGKTLEEVRHFLKSDKIIPRNLMYRVVYELIFENMICSKQIPEEEWYLLYFLINKSSLSIENLNLIFDPNPDNINNHDFINGEMNTINDRLEKYITYSKRLFNCQKVEDLSKIIKEFSASYIPCQLPLDAALRVCIKKIIALEKKPKKNIYDINCQSEYQKVMEKLIHHGAQLEAKDSEGNSGKDFITQVNEILPTNNRQNDSLELNELKDVIDKELGREDGLYDLMYETMVKVSAIDVSYCNDVIKKIDIAKASYLLKILSFYVQGLVKIKKWKEIVNFFQTIKDYDEYKLTLHGYGLEGYMHLPIGQLIHDHLACSNDSRESLEAQHILDFFVNNFPRSLERICFVDYKDQANFDKLGSEEVSTDDELNLFTENELLKAYIDCSKILFKCKSLEDLLRVIDRFRDLKKKHDSSTAIELPYNGALKQFSEMWSYCCRINSPDKDKLIHIIENLLKLGADPDIADSACERLGIYLPQTIKEKIKLEGDTAFDNIIEKPIPTEIRNLICDFAGRSGILDDPEARKKHIQTDEKSSKKEVDSSNVAADLEVLLIEERQTPVWENNSNSYQSDEPLTEEKTSLASEANIAWVNSLFVNNEDAPSQLASMDTNDDFPLGNKKRSRDHATVLEQSDNSASTKRSRLDRAQGPRNVSTGNSALSSFGVFPCNSQAPESKAEGGLGVVLQKNDLCMR